MSKHLRLIGLTGGIATGKTTVSHYLATTHHLTILDADLYARDAVKPGSLILQQISDRYGQKFLLPDGSLDRRRLGDIIFSQPSERLWLEQQIHPYVRQALLDGIRHHLTQANSEAPLILVVPLLFEAQMTDLVTETWVVYCPTSQQVERLQQRDRLTLEQVQARIESQMPVEEKAAHADVVLDNSSTLESLLHQVDCALGQPI